MQANCGIQCGALNIDNIKVSPLGVTLAGRGEFNKSMAIPISVKITDGSIREMGPGICYSDSGKIKLKYISALPLDISKIESIVINGKDVNFN